MSADSSATQSERSVRIMLKLAAFVFFVAGITAQIQAQSSNLLARFDGGIGVIPVSSGTGPVNADGTLPNARVNVVRGVNPGGGPWRIAELRADIDRLGNIEVRGQGLLLASGNSIGQNANQSVFATLICEATAPFVEHSTSSVVPLDPAGNFVISDTLTSVPTECPSPVLLIRNAAGAWFAAGVAKSAGVQ
jgi:hypothetical protein